MSKQQFWTLNVVGGICALLILGTIVLGEVNNRMNQSALFRQSQFNRAQQMQGTARNLLSRIAQDAAKEPELKALLDRHQVRFNPETPAKANP